MSSDLNDLSLLLNSKVPILAIESYEEPRVLEMVTRLAIRKAMFLYTWSITEGICRLGFGEDKPSVDSSRDATEVLKLIKSSTDSAIYVLCDFHPYLKDEPINVRLLREIAMGYHSLGKTKSKLDTPKGIMLLGIQGGGKSLAAKAVAGMWGLPLLRLDFATLYNKFHGETERNLREALKLADLMSPCVLWLDEIEKGISISQNDQGTSSRLLGTLLTWMAERKSSVFIVATSNDITQLPPEFVRKDHFSEG